MHKTSFSTLSIRRVSIFLRVCFSANIVINIVKNLKVMLKVIIFGLMILMSSFGNATQITPSNCPIQPKSDIRGPPGIPGRPGIKGESGDGELR